MPEAPSANSLKSSNAGLAKAVVAGASAARGISCRKSYGVTMLHAYYVSAKGADIKIVVLLHISMHCLFRHFRDS